MLKPLCGLSHLTIMSVPELGSFINPTVRDQQLKAAVAACKPRRSGSEPVVLTSELHCLLRGMYVGWILLRAFFVFSTFSTVTLFDNAGGKSLHKFCFAIA